MIQNVTDYIMISNDFQNMILLGDCCVWEPRFITKKTPLIYQTKSAVAQGMPAAEEYAVNTDLEGQIEHVRQMGDGCRARWLL